jgi:hypothetical protein
MIKIRIRIKMRKMYIVFKFFYFLVASSILAVFYFQQYSRNNIVPGKGLLLGWDSPRYVWQALGVISFGPQYLIEVWGYTHFYVLLLAVVGYLLNNVILAEVLLPLILGILLLFLLFEYAKLLFDNVHFAGLTIILMPFSLNFLRILADLHRNLMAINLVYIGFLLLLKYYNSYKMKYVITLFVVAIILAGTQIETYAVFSATIIFFLLFLWNIKLLKQLIWCIVLPLIIIFLLVPRFFFSYLTVSSGWAWKIYTEKVLQNIIITWCGGSFPLVILTLAGSLYLVVKSIKKSKIALLLITWVFILILPLILYTLRIFPLPVDFIERALVLLPTPMLEISAINLLYEIQKNILKILNNSALSKIIKIFLLSIIILVFCYTLLTSSTLSKSQVKYWYTPYIPRSAYNKILIATNYLKILGYSQYPPIFIFYGDPGFWFAELYRSYIGIQIGEHFAYYGKLEDLLALRISEPSSRDPQIQNKERVLAYGFMAELKGDSLGVYRHKIYIKQASDILNYTIVIIKPEFYSYTIPKNFEQYKVSEGIYIIPPKALASFYHDE